MASTRVRSAGVRALRARPARFGLWASFVRPVRRGHVQRGRRRVDLRRLRARADSVRVGSERMRTVRGGEICLECHRLQRLPAIRRGALEPPRRRGLRHLRSRLLLRRTELPRLSLVGDVRAELDAAEPVDRARGLLSLLHGHAARLSLQKKRRLRGRSRGRRRHVRTTTADRSASCATKGTTWSQSCGSARGAIGGRAHSSWSPSASSSSSFLFW